ncbi:MAG: AMP-binding protein, partial [Acidimicrobiales bacterium]
MEAEDHPEAARLGASDDRRVATLERAMELCRRDDSHLTEEKVRRLIDSGGWALDTFVDLLDAHARERPGAVAVIDQDGSELTWSGLAERSRALAVALYDRGYRRGDALGVQLPNWSEFCVVVLGAARLGVRSVFVHTPYRAYEMEYILGLTGARGLVVPARYRGTDHLALAEELRGRLDSLVDLIVVRGGDEPGSAARLPA